MNRRRTGNAGIVMVDPRRPPFSKTVLLVSHNRDEVFRLAERIAVMNRAQPAAFIVSFAVSLRRRRDRFVVTVRLL